MIQDLKRSKRWSILPAFTVDGYIAWEVHQGSITAEIFNDFVRVAEATDHRGGSRKQQQKARAMIKLIQWQATND